VISSILISIWLCAGWVNSLNYHRACVFRTVHVRRVGSHSVALRVNFWTETWFDILLSQSTSTVFLLNVKSDQIFCNFDWIFICSYGITLFVNWRYIHDLIGQDEVVVGDLQQIFAVWSACLSIFHALAHTYKDKPKSGEGGKTQNQEHYYRADTTWCSFKLLLLLVWKCYRFLEPIDALEKCLNCFVYFTH
jgi:hypothetical protein